MVKRSVEQDLRNKNFGARNGNYEKKRRGQHQTAWTKNSWRLLAMESQRAVFQRRQLHFSVTMLISVQNWHSRIRLQILSCSRVREMRRQPEVPEEKVPVVECFDGHARITLEELAITHFVKNGTLQDACSTWPRVVVGLVKSAHMHTVRLNSRLKGPNRMMTKVQ